MHGAGMQKTEHTALAMQRHSLTRSREACGERVNSMKNRARYCNLPDEYSSRERSKIAIVPVPYDGTSTWMKGADRGPEALIGASAYLELYDIETDTEVYRHGIFTDDPVLESATPEKMIAAVRERVAEHINDGKFTVVIGGEHSVSIGAARAHADAFHGLTVLQLDAHADMRDVLNGSPNNHGCVMARIREFAPVVQAGIRSMDISEKKNIDTGRIFYAENIQGTTSWMDDVIALLSDTVYITIYLDVFDPSLMPATGTPEPGGLFWYDVVRLLRKVAGKKKIAGFDVVELCPHAEKKQCDFLAAKLVYKLLSYVMLSDNSPGGK